MLTSKFLGILAIAGAAVSAYYGLRPTENASLTLEFPTVIDIGTVPQESDNFFEFTVSNPSQFDVEILEVAPSCSCTKVRLSDRIVRAGQSINVEGWIQVDKEETVSSTIALMYHAVGQSEVTGKQITFRGNAKKEPSVE